MPPLIFMSPYNDQTVENDDPYWDQVSLFLKMEGTNNSTTFTDEKEHSILAVAPAKITTAMYKNGTSSADLSGGRLEISPSSDFNFGSGNFTVESWVYLPSLGGYRQIADSWIHGINNYLVGEWEVIIDPSGRVIFDLATGPASYYRIQSDPIFVAGAWQHIAIGRNSGILSIFLNGVLRYSGGASGNCGISSQLVYLGRGLSGYLDDVRITKGVARYTSNFTPV